jgi:hypothetical protein
MKRVGVALAALGAMAGCQDAELTADERARCSALGSPDFVLPKGSTGDPSLDRRCRQWFAKVRERMNRAKGADAVPFDVQDEK